MSHLAQLREVARPLGIGFLGLGMTPDWTRAEIPTMPKGRYRIIKEIIGEPHSSVLLIHTRVEIREPKLRGKSRLYALLAPHLKGTGQDNSARCDDTAGRKFIQASREDVHVIFGCAPDFTRRSAGFVRHGDGWQDLMANLKMDWEYA